MNIFDRLAKTFAPRAKAPNVEQLESLECDAAAALEAARTALATVEAGRVQSLLEGDDGRAAHRVKAREAEADLADAEAALEIVRERLRVARLEAAEAGKREVYARAKAAQQAAADEVKAKYTAAIDELKRLQCLVNEADELVASANRALPAGAEPLPPEAEGLCRDWAAEPEQVLGREVVRLWCSESGDPLPEQDRVRPLSGDRGLLDIESWRTSHGMPVTRMTFEKITTRKWRAPAYAARLKDLELPALRPEKPAPGDVEVSFAPIAPAAAEPPAEAAE